MFASHRFPLIRGLILVSAAIALLSLASARPAHAATLIHVRSLGDDNNANGNCTLREAILAANTNANVDECFGLGGGTGDVIDFILGPGTPEIDIGTLMLPDITESVHIEGKSNSEPKVVIHGPDQTVSGHNGLTIDSSAIGTEIDDLVINNFPDDGVLIEADAVTLQGDYIGTTAAGDFPRPNQGYGVLALGVGDQIGAANNGSCASACSLISGNNKANIVLGGSHARILGNYIGTDATGEHALLSPPVEGIVDYGQDDTIGGTSGTTPGGDGCSGACNVIAGVGDGIRVLADATGSVIEGNYVGVDALGSNELTSTPTSGIISLADGVTIGGTTEAARNVISGSSYINVLLEGRDSVLEGNFIGTTAAGNAPISGTNWSVYVKDASGPTIGGTTPGTANRIGGGTDSGIAIVTSTGVQIEGNFIGVTADGTSLRNGSGVSIDDNSSGNVVGGTAQGAGNTIADNDYGVYINGVAPTVHHDAVRRNSIYGNSSKGIYLENHANDDIQAPVINGVGPLHGTACANCTIEVFSDVHDQGNLFEGTTTANGAGDWTFNGSLSGPNATTTATDLNNNTSEFSAPVSTFVATPTPSPSPTVHPTPTASPSGSYVQGNVNCDGFVDDNDFDYLLEYVAGLNNGMTSGCYSLGDPNAPGGYAWGDLNCDGHVNALDGLYLLAKKAGITLTPLGPGCTPIGTAFS